MEKGGFGKVFRNNLFNRLKTFKTLFTGIITGIYAADPKCKRLRHCPKRVCEQIKIQKTLDFFLFSPMQLFTAIQNG